MRQLTVLPSEPAARTLAAFLVTERIAAHVDAEKSGYSVWVRDEDQLPRAREILEHFRQSPGDPRYHGAERSAEALRREEDRLRRQKQSKVVEMRGRWGTGGGIKKRCPLIIGLIIACVLVAVATGMGQNPLSSVTAALKFADNSPRVRILPDEQESVLVMQPDGGIWDGVLSGQIWRLITPILLHFSIAHLVFNVWCLFDEGGQIEDRRGSLFVLALILAIAILSNIAQAIVAGPHFGGMSGVVYGLLGYLWMKVKFDNSAGYVLSKQTVFIAMVFFGLCIARDFPPFDSVIGRLLPPIANAAHIVGLAMGLAIGYAPLLFRRK